MMSSLRPMHNVRPVSVTEYSPYNATSRRSIATPLHRHTSVVEGVENKQREGLKERMKLLHPVLPSRKIVSSNVVSKKLPVIVKAPPVGRVALPKNPPRKTPYQSVLALTADPAPPEGEPFRMTRRHSIGGLMGPYRGKERSSSDSNGDAFKIESLFADRVSLDKYKKTNSDANQHKTDPDAKQRSNYLIAKDDSHLEREKKSSVVTFLPVSKPQNQILTNIETAEVRPKEALNPDAKMNGSWSKGDDDDDVFNLQSTSVKDALYENLNIKQISKNHGFEDDIEKKADIDCLINGHKENTTKTDIEENVIEPMKVSFHTNSEKVEATEEFGMTGPQANGDRETRYSDDQEPQSLASTGIECAMLIDIDDTSSASPSHSRDLNDEDRLEKAQEHISEAAELETFPELACLTQTEAMEKVAEIQSVELDGSFLDEERQSTFNDNTIHADIQAMTTNVAHDFSLDLKQLKTNDIKSNDETDSFWSTVEDSLTGPVKTTSNISHSELIEIEFQKNPDDSLVKLDFSDIDSKETNENDDRSKSEALWPDFEESLTSSSGKFSSESVETVVQKYSDSDLGNHDLSNDLKELIKTDNESDDRSDDGVFAAVQNSFIGSDQTTSSKSRSELIEVEIQKCPDAGLGFCVEGGGNQPVTVKRVFNAATSRCLKEGDEILTVCNQDTSTLTPNDARKLFKSLPDGPVKMKIIRRMD